MSRLPRPWRALVLDLDGTLADTFAHLADCFATALEPRLGRRLAPAEVYATFGPGAGTESAILAKLGGGEHPNVVATFFRIYEDRHQRGALLFPGMREVLDAARGRGLGLGLLTGKGRRTTEITLRALDVRQYLDAVVTGDEAPRPKPDPRGLCMTLEALGVAAAEALFVGDSVADVGAGLAAGVRTALARWNHHGEPWAPPPHADFMLADPCELARLIASAEPAVASRGVRGRG